MLGIFFEGMLLGLTLAFLLGPSFFAVVQTSIKNGFRSGVALALGISLSDIVCVLLAYLGASSLFNNPKYEVWEGIIGGFILIGFGVFILFQRHHIEEDLEFKTINVPLLIVKGFFLNILNPFVLLFWIGWVGLVGSKYNFSAWNTMIFFLGTQSAVFSTDVLKSLAANKIKQFLKPRLFVMVNRITGVILIIFGIVVMVRVLM